MSKTFLSSFLAGALIALGCGINLACGGGLLGAFLFSLGLMSICTLGLKLYTGRIGFMLVEPKVGWKSLGMILLGNLLGAFFIGVLLGLTQFSLIPAAAAIISSKLLTWWTVFGNSFFCGMLMYLAVALYQKGQTIGILLCIPAFILSGFEHCIAFMGYLAISGFFPLLALPYLLIAILGNSIGSYFVSIISNYIKEK